MSNTMTDHLPPLSDTERAEVRADFARWYAAHAAEDHTFDRTNGERTWEWAYWHYQHGEANDA